MKAYLVSDFEQTPSFQEIVRPIPKQGEVLVRIKACGLNFADLLMLKGIYQETPEPPFTPGLEISGVVVAVGPNTDGPKIDTPVAVYGGSGGLAEYGVFPVDRIAKIPTDMSFETAAGFQVAYGTSHLALQHRAHLKSGETLVVMGAAGGVGLTAVEIGKLMGASVIACARGAEKLAVAKAAGADHLLDTDTVDLRSAIKDLGGADVVYDAVGGEAFNQVFRACNPDARILAIGFASGKVPEVKLNHMLVKNISLIGFYWGGYLKFAPEVLLNSMAQLMAWHSESKLSPAINHVFDFDETEAALAMLRERRSTGKIVIKMSNA